MALLGPKIEWHTLEKDEILEILETDLKTGLKEEEVRSRREKYGRNTLGKQHGKTIFERLLNQITSPLVFILIIAGVITFILGEYIDSLVIFIAVSINVIIGILQEKKASQAFEKLQSSQVKKAIVLREGTRKVIEASDLVRGDIIFLESGKNVPADIKIAVANNLEVNESILTGEWKDVSKDNLISKRESQVTEQNSMAFMGTVISGGSGIGIVVEIGENTEIGQIAETLKGPEDEITPIQRNIKKIARFLTVVIGAATVLIFALGLLRGEPIGEMLLISIAVAVSVIPEGLPAAVTVVLALGMERILKEGGLVKNLLAAETLGSTTIILTDKTGTLTEAKMRLADLFSLNQILPEGDALKDNKELVRSAVLASDAFIEEDKKTSKMVARGRPIEKSIILKGLEEGISSEVLSKEGYERIDFLPFDSELRMAASLNKTPDGKIKVFISGSPEHILNQSSFVLKNGRPIRINRDHLNSFEMIQEKKSREGYRFISVASKETKIKSFKDIKNFKEFFRELVYTGLISFEDPVRLDAKDSIAKAKLAGAQVIMLTGDYKYTALKIATDVGIASADSRVLEGKDLEEMNDKDLLLTLKTVNVFARVLPSQKLRIAKVLKGSGEVVAMTGDGINDAPALRAADIGVAVGSGTEVAKEASDLILLDNNFSIIVSAIEEGRRIIDNLKKIVAFLFSTSFGEIFVISGALILGFPLPILPAQILWINIVEGGALNFAFAFEEGEPDLMKRDPRDVHERNILNKSMQKLVLSAGVVTGLLSALIFFILMSINLPISEIRTIMFVVLSLDAIFFSFSFKGLRTPIWKTNLFSNKYLVFAVFISLALLIAALVFNPLSTILSIVPLSLNEVLILVLIGLFNLFIIEASKYLIFTRRLNR